MKYRNFVTCWLLVLLAGVSVWAQQPPKTRKPVKNPPQYPNIIDMEGRTAPKPQNPAPPETPTPAPLTASDALVRAVEALTGEVRTLVGEIRSLNLRQQAQLELTRLTRLDLRLDHYEREIKPVRDRLAALEAEEQGLTQLITRDSLFAQTAALPTMDRETSMRQLKQQHEYRLNLVRGEKERLKAYEVELNKQLLAVRAAGVQSEERMQATEEQLKRNHP